MQFIEIERGSFVIAVSSILQIECEPEFPSNCTTRYHKLLYSQGIEVRETWIDVETFKALMLGCVGTRWNE